MKLKGAGHGAGRLSLRSGEARPKQESVKAEAEPPAATCGAASTPLGFVREHHSKVAKLFGIMSLASSLPSTAQLQAQSAAAPEQIQTIKPWEARLSPNTAVLDFATQSVRPQLHPEAEAAVQQLLSETPAEHRKALLSALDVAALAEAPANVQKEVVRLLGFAGPDHFAEMVQRALERVPGWIESGSLVDKVQSTFKQWEQGATVDAVRAFYGQSASDVVQDLLFPERIHQGSAGTCVPTSIQHMLARHQPAKYVDIVSKLAHGGAEGTVKDTLQVRQNFFLLRDSDMTKLHVGGRRTTERTFQSAVMEQTDTWDYDERSDRFFTSSFDDYKTKRFKEIDASLARIDSVQENLPAVLAERFPDAPDRDALASSLSKELDTRRHELQQKQKYPVLLREEFLQAVDSKENPGLLPHHILAAYSALLDVDDAGVGKASMERLRRLTEPTIVSLRFNVNHAVVLNGFHQDSEGQEWVHLWNPWSHNEDGNARSGPPRELLDNSGNIRMKVEDFSRALYVAAVPGTF